MTFAKEVAARLAQFTLLLAFVGLTGLPGLAQKRAIQPDIGLVQDRNDRHTVVTDTDANDVQEPAIQPSTHTNSTNTNEVQQRANQPHIGLVQDWSHRHIVFTNTNDVQTRVKQASDLRALSFWIKRTRVQNPNGFAGGPIELPREATPSRLKRKGGGTGGGAISGVSVDWALPLGKGIGASIANYGGLAAGAYPAKYSFDINATPDCINDYIAMGLNTPGSATTPNVVGINNLYSNSVGGGFCSGTGPAAYFAYFTASANPTSVVVSLDGTKIAWVENAATAVFHVLAWKANDGTLAAPVQLSLHVVAAAPVVNSGTMTSLNLASTDTNSSPYYDYTTDTAYVGNNNGQLFKIKNVFCQTIASPGANSTCAGAAPSLAAPGDGWAANPVSIIAGQILTSPVLDTYITAPAAVPLVFVGASGGTVRARIASSGAAPTTNSLAVGDGSASGGIVDPPVIDVTNHKLYVATGCNGTSALAVQNPYNSNGFGASLTANIGRKTNIVTACPTDNMHAPTPDDAYITAIQSSTTTFSGNMIFCGATQAGNSNYQAVLYKFPVTNGTMGTTPVTSGNTVADGFGVTAADAECSSITDVFNSNFAAPTERIYMGIGGTLDGHLRSFDAAFTTPAVSAAKTVTPAWTVDASNVVTFPVPNSPVTIGPGNYVTIAGTANGTCGGNTNGTFEVTTSTTTQIQFVNPARVSCTGTAAGTATSDNTIPGI